MNVSAAQRQFWNDHSYLVFKGFFAAQEANLKRWVEEVSAWPDDFSKWLKFYEMDDPSKLSRIENFVPYHAGLASLLMQGPMVDIISELMGEPALLYKERINFKPPGGGAHAAHQDGVAYESGDLATFKADSVPYVSILIGVDHATVENGCLQVVPEWPLSKLDILRMERPYPEHPSFSKIAQSIEDALPWIPIETAPGDVLLFTERLPHRSTANHSAKGRRILYGVYNPSSEGDKRVQYYETKRRNINDARYMVGNPHAPTRLPG
jgi:hypothetical protein